eukprot:1860544-Ditylum_brightwellii.AAC.1
MPTCLCTTWQSLFQHRICGGVAEVLAKPTSRDHQTEHHRPSRHVCNHQKYATWRCFNSVQKYRGSEQTPIRTGLQENYEGLTHTHMFQLRAYITQT